MELLKLIFYNYNCSPRVKASSDLVCRRAACPLAKGGCKLVRLGISGPSTCWSKMQSASPTEALNKSWVPLANWGLNKSWVPLANWGFKQKLKKKEKEKERDGEKERSCCFVVVGIEPLLCHSCFFALWA